MHFRDELVAYAQVTVIEVSQRRHELLSDELGRFTVPVPADQVELVTASSAGLLGLAYSPANDVVDVELRQPWRVSGVVRDAAGAPVAGARVFGAWRTKTCTGPVGGAPVFEALTSANGAYEIATPFAENWLAAAAGARTSEQVLELFGASEWSTVDFSLPEDGSEAMRLGIDDVSFHRDRASPRPLESDEFPLIVDFRAVSEGGVALDGVHTSMDDDAHSAGRTTVTTRWSERWTEMLGARAIVTLDRRGYAALSREFAPVPTVSLGDVQFEPAQGLTISVVDRLGAPISGCSLWLETRTAWTDAAGSVWVPRGSKPLRISPGRCCRGENVVIPPGVFDVVLSLERDDETCNSGPTG